MNNRGLLIIKLEVIPGNFLGAVLNLTHITSYRPTRSEAITSFPSNNSRTVLAKGTSFDGSIDSPLEEDTNGNKINKNRRKGWFRTKKSMAKVQEQNW